MIWRRISGAEVGDTPPPSRPFYPGYENNVPTNDLRIVWVQSKTIVTTTPSTGSGTTVDSGWSDWVQLAAFVWPLSFVASKNSSSTVISQVLIQTGGRRMPWQIVNQLTQTTTLPDPVRTVVSNSDETLDIIPGDLLTFSYSVAGTNVSININESMILVPAEGV